MRKLIEYVNDEESLWVEVDEIEPSGFKPYGAGLSKKQNLEDVLSIIKPFSALIFKKVGELTPSPSEIEVEFGVKLNTKVGAILACASAEGNYNIKIKWVNGIERK